MHIAGFPFSYCKLRPSSICGALLLTLSITCCGFAQAESLILAAAAQSTEANTKLQPALQAKPTQPSVQEDSMLSGAYVESKVLEPSLISDTTQAQVVGTTTNEAAPNSLIKSHKNKKRDPFGNYIEDTSSTVEIDVSATTMASTAITNTQSALAASNEVKSSFKDNKALVATSAQEPRIVVLFFSQPEHIQSKDVDELSGASIVFNKQQHKKEGTVEFLARIIGRKLNAPVFTIVPYPSYPKDHDDLIEQASYEYDRNIHPNITIFPRVNLSNYDVIFIGYPIWWYDLPKSLYTLFEQNDFSGKTIVPFCSHGGSRSWKTFNIIKKLEPNAKHIASQEMVFERLDVPYVAEERITKVLESLGFLQSKEQIVEQSSQTPAQELNTKPQEVVAEQSIKPPTLAKTSTTQSLIPKAVK